MNPNPQSNCLLSFVTVCQLACAISFAAHTVPITVHLDPFQEHLNLSGTVQPFESVDVNSKWGGLVKRIPVTVGSLVKKGDLLAEVEVTYLKAGAQFFESRIDFLQSQVDQATADEKLMKTSQQRTRHLASQQIVSKVEEEKSDMRFLEMGVARLRAEKDLNDTKRALASLQEKLRGANYYAPMDGVITELVVDPKQLMGSFNLMGNQTVARIDKPGKYIVIATLLDSQVAPLKLGQHGNIYFGESDHAILGQLINIKPRALSQKDGIGMFEATFGFVKPGPMINRGLRVRVEMALGEEAKVLSVPWNAIRVTPDKALVTRMNASGIAEEVVVTIGRRDLHRAEVTKGLQDGDTVLASLW